MELKFTKMHGCGNDYIFINCFEKEITAPEQLAVQLSDRHFGVGGDGIVLILPSRVADAGMRMFNADGSEGKMCGNAIRCVAKYLFDNNIVPKTEMTIETLAGIKTLKLSIDGGGTGDGSLYHDSTMVQVDMGMPEFRPERIPVNLPGDQVVLRPVTIGGVEYAITCVSMGNPHCVVFCESVDTLDLPRIGPLFEHNPLFPERVNTEFVEVLGKNHIKMRVWERGSGETLACGTGACAVVVALTMCGLGQKDTDVRVSLPGGELTICYTDQGVLMTGGCCKVFEGTIAINE